MFTLSAFADEIDPDPQAQLDVLTACGVRHIEFRSILKTNVLALSDLQVQEFKSLLDRHGFGLSAIGSPVGKVRVDEPFDVHLEKFNRAVYLAQFFGTPNIRVFSYYPPAVGSGDWDDDRDEVMRRMTAKLGLAEKAGVRLLHENEHRIYGDSPARVRDVLTTLARFFPKSFGAAYDPANFVFCGYDPLDGWEASKDYVVHLHVKDWKKGEPHHGSPAGEGDGRVPEVVADLVKRGYDGFATLEPHLMGGGPTGGVTGPELFPKAVDAFRRVLDGAGAEYQ